MKNQIYPGNKVYGNNDKGWVDYVDGDSVFITWDQTGETTCEKKSNIRKGTFAGNLELRK